MGQWVPSGGSSARIFLFMTENVLTFYFSPAKSKNILVSNRVFCSSMMCLIILFLFFLCNIAIFFFISLEWICQILKITKIEWSNHSPTSLSVSSPLSFVCPFLVSNLSFCKTKWCIFVCFSLDYLLLIIFCIFNLI